MAVQALGNQDALVQGSTDYRNLTVYAEGLGYNWNKTNGELDGVLVGESVVVIVETKQKAIATDLDQLLRSVAGVRTYGLASWKLDHNAKVVGVLGTETADASVIEAVERCTTEEVYLIHNGGKSYEVLTSSPRLTN